MGHWARPPGRLLEQVWTGIYARTGRTTEYPLPRSTNIRRVYVDHSNNPGTLWIGSNHGASSVKVEPLD